MSNFFSKERLKNLAISILLLFITNIFTSWIHLRSYAYNDLSNSLTSVILYMDELQADIFQKKIDYKGPDERSIYPSTDIIMDIQFKEMRLSTSLDIETGDLDWEDIRAVVSKVITILESDTVTDEDIEYLDLAYSYMDEIQSIYETLYMNGSPIAEENSFLDINGNKKAYTNFMQKTEELSEQPKYQTLLRDEENQSLASEGYMYSSADEKKAEEFSREIFKKATGQSDKVQSLGFDYGRYIFENMPEKNNDDEIYHMEVSADSGDFFMYKSVRYSKGAITEKKMDEMAADLISAITDKNYICYEKIPEYYDEKIPQEIKYRFIRKTEDIYNENRMIDITLDNYGQISYIEIFGVLKEEADIQTLQKPDISEEFKQYDPEQIILVQNKDGGLQYHIYSDYKGDMYTTKIDADTMKMESVEKSENLYYKEIALR